MLKNHYFFSEMEPLNRDRVAQVLTLCSELEDLFKETTSKRKKYPQQITEGMKKILQRQRELLVRRMPIVLVSHLLFIILMEIKVILDQSVGYIAGC